MAARKAFPFKVTAVGYSYFESEKMGKENGLGGS